MNEQALQQHILAAIGSLPGVLVWRQNVGKAPSAWQRLPAWLDDWIRSSGFNAYGPGPLHISGGRLVQYGTPGQADIMAIRAGRLLAIEVKTATGRQSAAQLAWQRALEAAGGVYVVARSVDDAVAALERLNNGD